MTYLSGVSHAVNCRLRFIFNDGAAVVVVAIIFIPSFNMDSMLVCTFVNHALPTASMPQDISNVEITCFKRIDANLFNG
jgi:hypothetical protein